jgi:hypothetical protein
VVTELQLKLKTNLSEHKAKERSNTGGRKYDTISLVGLIGLVCTCSETISGALRNRYEIRKFRDLEGKNDLLSRDFLMGSMVCCGFSFQMMYV